MPSKIKIPVALRKSVATQVILRVIETLDPGEPTDREIWTDEDKELWRGPVVNAAANEAYAAVVKAMTKFKSAK